MPKAACWKSVQRQVLKALSDGNQVKLPLCLKFSVIVAQHVMLLDGKQIVTWPQIEEMIAKTTEPVADATQVSLYARRSGNGPLRGGQEGDMASSPRLQAGWTRRGKPAAARQLSLRPHPNGR